MKIGELFVDLASKGGKETKDMLAGVGKGMKGLFSSSIETKLAITGVFYGLKQLMDFGMRTGEGLTKFSAITNMSAEALQKWQYAGRQVNVSNEAVEQSFKSVQQAMGDMLIGKGAPEGMNLLANSVGFDTSKVEDTFYVMEKLQEYANKNKGNATLTNTVLRSFGVTEDMMVGLKKMAFTKDKMKNAPIFSDKETNALNKADIAFDNIIHGWKMLAGKSLASGSGEMMSLIKEVNGGLMKATQALVKAASGPLKDVLISFNDIVKSVFTIIKSISGESIGLKEIFSGFAESVGVLKDVFAYMAGTEDKEAMAKKYNNDDGLFGAIKEVAHGAYLTAKDAVAPHIPIMHAGASAAKQVTVTQNLNFQHDGKDATKTGRSVKEANQAFWQLQQNRGK
jgi:hypothetical protein